MVEKCKSGVEHSEVVELDELYWFLERKEQTRTRENLYIITMVSRYPRQIVGHLASQDKYYTDGYFGYLDVVFPGKHVYNPHNKKNTFTVEGVNADLRHYIPTLARRSRCFPRKLENLSAVLSVFVAAYNRFGLEKARFSSLYPYSSPPFSLFDFL